MVHLYSNCFSQKITSLFLLLALVSFSFMQARITSLNRFDPFKEYSAIDPQDFLLDRTKLKIEGADWWSEVGQWCKISVSGFFQTAKDGHPMDGGDIPVESIIDGSTSTSNTIGFAYEPILDLDGRTPMIPLVMNTNATAPGPYGPLLTKAAEVLFGDPPPIKNIEEVIDPKQNFGFFSLPSRYRKRGARMELLINLFCGAGLHVKGSFASICHTPKPPINLTCLELTCPFQIPQNTPCCEGVTKDNVNTYLMNEYDCIIKEIGMTNQTFQKTALEELVAELYWRHAFELDADREGWPHILAIPYVEGGFGFSPTNARNTSDLFSVPFGNNEHIAAGICAGLCIDFAETIELGGEIGYTHFFDHDFDCFRVPNSKLQNNIFPFTTSVNIQPGHNIHYSAKLTARNFLERLSGYFEFVVLEHAQDCIKVLNDPNHVFVPEVLNKKSGFKIKLANISFTYPLTPNFIFGFLWQAPISQRNCPRASTVLFGVTGSF